MQLITGDRLAERIDGVVHRDTQESDVGFDLTVAAVEVLTGPGSLDFGGSEFAEAATEALEPAPASPDDEYGWWRLGEGHYRVRFNETLRLRGGEVATIRPHPRLLAAGAAHGAVDIVSGDGDELSVLLTVGITGCRLKENCRVSRLKVWEEAPA